MVAFSRYHVVLSYSDSNVVLSYDSYLTKNINIFYFRYSPPPKRTPDNTSSAPRERSRSPIQRRQYPSPPRYPNLEGSGSPGDIGDEIQEEIRRQKRRQEEERRREDRRRRHQKREELERREAEERKKRE